MTTVFPTRAATPVKKALFLFGKALSFLVVVAVLSSCEDDDTPQPTTAQATELRVLTGLTFLNEVASPIGRAGNPNDFGDLVVYPNPSTGIVTIARIDRQAITKAWLIAVDTVQSLRSVDMEAAFAGFGGYSDEDLSAAAVVQSTFINPSPSQQLDLSANPAGYYRLVTQTNDGSQAARSLYVDSSLVLPSEVIPTLLDEWP